RRKRHLRAPGCAGWPRRPEALERGWERTARSHGTPTCSPARLERAHIVGTGHRLDARSRTSAHVLGTGPAITDAAALEGAVWAGGDGGDGVRRSGDRL